MYCDLVMKHTKLVRIRQTTDVNPFFFRSVTMQLKMFDNFFIWFSTTDHGEKKLICLEWNPLLPPIEDFVSKCRESLKQNCIMPLTWRTFVRATGEFLVIHIKKEAKEREQNLTVKYFQFNWHYLQSRFRELFHVEFNWYGTYLFSFSFLRLCSLVSVEKVLHSIWSTRQRPKSQVGPCEFIWWFILSLVPNTIRLKIEQIYNCC